MTAKKSFTFLERRLQWHLVCFSHLLVIYSDGGGGGLWILEPRFLKITSSLIPLKLFIISTILGCGMIIHLVSLGTIVSVRFSSQYSNSGSSSVVSISILRSISLASWVDGSSSFLGFGGGAGSFILGVTFGIGIAPDDLKHETT